MTEAATPLLLSVIAALLSMLVGLVAFFGQRGLAVQGNHGGRLTVLESCYLRRHPEEYQSFKVGGSD